MARQQRVLWGVLFLATAACLLLVCAYPALAAQDAWPNASSGWGIFVTICSAALLCA